MKKEELIKIKGGSISATFISAISRGVTALYDVGRSFGSALRRAIGRKSCPL